MRNYGGLYYNGICPSVLFEHLKIVKSVFTKRELEIIKLLAEGFTAKDIAEELHMAVGTVRTHRKNLFLKTDFKNTTQLVAKCIRQGLV